MEKLSVRNLVETVKDEMVMREKILSELVQGPQTIPQLASALDVPSSEVMFWVMAMWRYGFVEEIGKPDSEGYCKFQPVK